MQYLIQYCSLDSNPPPPSLVSSGIEQRAASGSFNVQPPLLSPKRIENGTNSNTEQILSPIRRQKRTIEDINTFEVSKGGRRAPDRLQQDHVNFCELVNGKAKGCIDTARKLSMVELGFTYFQRDFHAQKFEECGAPKNGPY